MEVVKCRVRARTPTGGTGPDEVLFLTRERQANGTFKHDYYMSNADPKVPLEEFARVAKAAHRIEECLERAKGEAGLGDYQVRNGMAWHHHQTLALLAAWFLNQETRRGKNPDPCAECFASVEMGQIVCSNKLQHRAEDPPMTKKTRKRFTSQEKVAILRLHLLEHTPVSGSV